MRLIAAKRVFPSRCKIRPTQRPALFSSQPESSIQLKERLRELCEEYLSKESKTLSHFYSVDLKTLHATLPQIFDIVKTDYEGRLDAAMRDAFPEHPWRPWLFQERVSFGFWNNVSHRKAFFDWYAREVLEKDPEDASTWYSVTTSHLNQHGAGFMLSRFYKESVIEAVTSLYHPKDGWMIWRFPRLPAGWWKSVENQRAYVEWFGTHKLNIKSLHDWYDISASQWQTEKLAGLLSSRYGNSLSRMLSTIYPDHPWLEWKFRGTPRRYWILPVNQRKYLMWAGKELGVRSMEDWYSVTTSQLLEKAPGASHFLGSLNEDSISNALKRAFPEHEWIRDRHIQSPKGS